MPIFPFYQYPYNMNRYYARNNYNKNISKESNNFNTSYNPPDSNNDINSVIETNRAEDKKINHLDILVLDLSIFKTHSTWIVVNQLLKF